MGPNSATQQAAPFTPFRPVEPASTYGGDAPSRSLSPSATPVDWSPSPTPEFRNRPQLPYFPGAIAPSIETPFPTEIPQPQNPPTSAAERGRGGTSSRGGRAGRGTRGTRGSVRSRGQKIVPISTRDQEQHDSPSDNEVEDMPRKKTRARGMNAQEKLALIRECCEHASEYRLNNKMAFWMLIRDLLKTRTGYLLKEPRNTVLRWVADRGDELVQEEMGSGTQVDQDDFKAAVEQFAGRVKAIQDELDEQVKTSKAKSAELYESARVQSAMVFGLDDEPIPGVDAPSNSATQAGPSIALNPLARVAANKRKREGSAAAEESLKEATMLAESFRDSSKELAKALMWGKALPAIDARPIASPIAEKRIAGVEARLSEVQNTMEARLDEVQSNFNARQGEVTSMLDRILAAVATIRSAGASAEGTLN